MPQGIGDHTDPLHADSAQEVVPTCIFELPIHVKHDFEENLNKFDRSDTTKIYVLRSQTFEKKSSTAKKKSVVRNFKLNEQINLMSAVPNSVSREAMFMK